MRINLNAYLYEKAKSIIEKWDEEGIYAISFFVYSNEMYTSPISPNSPLAMWRVCGILRKTL